MKKLLGALFLAVLALTSTASAVGSRMVCEKTGVTVESCCCVESQGEWICSLTGETVSSCCCSPAN